MVMNDNEIETKEKKLIEDKMEQQDIHGCMRQLERFSCDLEMKTREQNRNNKEKEIEWFDWLSNGYKRAWHLVG